MKTMVIVNGSAGGGRCAKAAPAALGVLRAGGMAFDVEHTQAQGDATRLAQQAYNNGVRRFIVLGGDGTTFEVINGLFPRAYQRDPVEIGMVPLGTGNSFLRDFGVESERDAFAAVLSGRSRGCDVVRLEHDQGVVFFINLLSLGFSATVGALRNRRYPGWGTMGYILAVAASLRKLEAERCECRVDDAPTNEVLDYVLLSFSNSQYTGGRMHMAPNASSSDGLVDIIHAAPMSRAQLLLSFPRIFRGSHIRLSKVQQRRAKRVRFSGVTNRPVMIDGEIMHLSPRCLEVLPHAIRVRVL